MLNIKLILGSTRENRFSEKLLPWITETLNQYPDLQVEVLDLRDFTLPYFESPMSPAYITDGNYATPEINAWAKKIKEADGFIIVAPEYNHGYSAVLKNALDVIYAEWNRKAVGFISYGSVGGGRVVEQLRSVAIELQMASTRNAVHIQAPWALQNEDGSLKDGVLDGYTHNLTTMAEELTWWAHALKDARNA